MGVLAEVKARARRKTGNVYDTYFTRRVSVYLTALLVPLGVSANAVSALNVVVGLGLCAGIATGDPSLSAAGAAAIHLYAVLDSVDGELARYHRKGSLKGIFLENWSAYLMLAAFPIGIALYLRRWGAGDAPLVLAIAYVALGRNAAAVARRTVLGVMQASPAYARSEALAAPPPREPGARPSLVGRARTLVEGSVLYHTNVWVSCSLALLAEAAGLAPRAKLVGPLFAFFWGGLLAKEALTVALVLGTPYLRRQIASAYGPPPEEPSRDAPPPQAPTV
jgi:phosphatidylglycerophosphate synthase